MQAKAISFCTLALLALFGSVVFINRSLAQKARGNAPPVIPKTWDEEALTTLQAPLADAHASPVHITSDFYYRLPVRTIYKSYPIYAPGKEPPGYLDRLKQQEPEIVFDATKLNSEAAWIKAGEVVFDAPIAYDDPIAIVSLSDVRNPAW